MAFPHLVTAEGLAPHAVARLYLFWPERPSAYVDIGETLDLKLAALHAHASQHRQPEQLDERIRGWAARTGAPVELAAAEAFTVIDLR
jgi:LmbE family N-acetylglucosaminyl deacetylase